MTTQVTVKRGSTEAIFYIDSATLLSELGAVLSDMPTFKQAFPPPLPNEIDVLVAGDIKYALTELIAQVGGSALVDIGDITMLLVGEHDAPPPLCMKVFASDDPSVLLHEVRVRVDSCAAHVAREMAQHFIGDMSGSSIQFAGRTAPKYFDLPNSFREAEEELPVLGRVQDVISRMPALLRPPAPSSIAGLRIIVDPGYTLFATEEDETEERAGFVEGPTEHASAGDAHHEAMMQRMHKFMVTSAGGADGDRAAVQLLTTCDGEPALTFFATNPNGEKVSKGGCFECGICDSDASKGRKVDDGNGLVRHCCGPEHVTKWIASQTSTSETKEGLLGRLPTKWAKGRNWLGKRGRDKQVRENAATTACAVATAVATALATTPMQATARFGPLAHTPVTVTPGNATAVGAAIAATVLAGNSA